MTVIQETKLMNTIGQLGSIRSMHVSKQLNGLARQAILHNKNVDWLIARGMLEVCPIR